MAHTAKSDQKRKFDHILKMLPLYGVLAGIISCSFLLGKLYERVDNNENKIKDNASKINGLDEKVDENGIKPPPSPPSDALLVLIGSGTVFNHLTDKFREAFDSSICAFTGPSVAGITMLTRKESGIPNELTCIGMSSTFIPESDLMTDEQWSEFQKNDGSKKIVALKIADDPLMVGLHRSDADCFNVLIKRKTIKDSVLLSYIRCDTVNYRFYMTSLSSGTKREFQNMFNRIDPTFNEFPSCGYEFDLFIAGGGRVLKQNKPALFLGSDSYLFGQLKRYPVVDRKGKKITRPLYLYFAVNKTNRPENNIYYIKGKKGRFLVKVAEICGHKNMVPTTFRVRDKPGQNLIEMDLTR